MRQVRPLLLTIALSVTQVIGWATAFNALAVMARPISHDLDLSLPVALAGSTVFLVALALTSRLLVPIYHNFGAGGTLTIGSITAAVGFVLISQSSGIFSYAFGWAILGAAGAAMLTAPAHALLVQALGKNAKRWIAAVMLGSGLSGTLGLPATTFMLENTDWRSTMLAFALVHLAVCAPLHFLASLCAGPHASATIQNRGSAERAEIALFRWLALSVSLTGFVTWGFAIVIVELLQASGLTLRQSVAAGALIGAAMVGARAAQFVFAPKLTASCSAIWATALLCVSLMLLYLGGPLGAWAFVVLFGAASGTISVARATLPLELFEADAYATMSGRLVLPMNLSFAAAPLVFAAILENGGVGSVLATALLLSLSAFVALIVLRRVAMQKGRA